MIVGKRHLPGPNLGRPALLMSVLALLALACFPVFAQAEDASGIQYSDAPPTATGENDSVQQKRPPIAKAAENGGASAPTDTAGSPAGDESIDGSSENESSSSDGGAAAKGNDGTGNGQGKPAGSATHASGPNVQHSGQISATPASQSSDGGSSPLVPILIAILVLAAISVGTVMYKQRRQRRGPTASAPSPKAS